MICLLKIDWLKQSHQSLASYKTCKEIYEFQYSACLNYIFFQEDPFYLVCLNLRDFKTEAKINYGRLLQNFFVLESPLILGIGTESIFEFMDIDNKRTKTYERQNAIFLNTFENEDT